MRLFCIPSRLGSPPRRRGKADAAPHGLLAQGITPAWAGKRSGASPRRSTTGDHPRVGGEKVDPTGNDWYTQGSPPHGRGKVEFVQLLVVGDRITPAWAGKRSPLTASKPTFWDHPRVSGEKRLRIASMIGDSGSPPHGRGKAAQLANVSLFLRITPAWAGKSAQSRRAAQRSDDRKGQASQPWSPPLWMMVIRPRP